MPKRKATAAEGEAASNETTTVRCDPELSHKLKVYAARARITKLAAANEALSEYLKKRGA